MKRCVRLYFCLKFMKSFWQKWLTVIWTSKIASHMHGTLSSFDSFSNCYQLFTQFAANFLFWFLFFIYNCYLFTLHKRICYTSYNDFNFLCIFRSLRQDMCLLWNFEGYQSFLFFILLGFDDHGNWSVKLRHKKVVDLNFDQ